MDILPDSWAGIWALQTPIAELLARAAVLYFGILFLLRLMPRRTGGELGTMDLVMILLVTEAATHSLGGYSSLGDGLFVIVSLMLIDYGVNALSYRARWFERLVAAPPVAIVIDGRIQRRNMRREFITGDELQAEMRAHDIKELSEVERAIVEPEGEITFITRSGPRLRPDRPPRA